MYPKAGVLFMSKIPIFIDTTLWVYAFTKTNENTEKHEVIKKIIADSSNIFVSPQIINELTCIFINNIKFFEKHADNMINSFYSNFKVINISKEILLKASQLRNYYNFRFHDSIALASALSAECSTFYSEYIEHDTIIDGKMKVKNPFI